MDFIHVLKTQRSIRKYTPEQITRKEMEEILAAGACAPNAGGGQRSMLVGVRDAQLTRKIGKLNYRPFRPEEVKASHVSSEQPSLIDDASLKDGFYGAPAVIAIFGEKDFSFSVADAFCSAENMILMATDLGLASCIISRGEETFATAEGQKLLKQWKVPENYICRVFVILGHLAGELPHSKPCRPGRCLVVEPKDREYDKEAI
ncbi:MAG: nitroreductase family protein [Acidaminococcus sp.]|jgi:nitroreductase|nr:nitroreductase family protein [Acidaminococcus sp.]